MIDAPFGRFGSIDEPLIPLLFRIYCFASGLTELGISGHNRSAAGHQTRDGSVAFAILPRPRYETLISTYWGRIGSVRGERL